MPDSNFNSPFWQEKTALTDSRQLRHPEQCIFFALKGKLQNGHIYIDELYQKGVRHFVISEKQTAEKYPEAQFLLTENPLSLLQDWAAALRRRFSIPVIGITGSNGKTIIKEWLYQLLHRDFFIVKSPKSYNSQLGVPLSVLQMQAEHQLAIFEAGISQVGEMSKLAHIISPTLGIFTNIGSAHNEGFSSIEEKINEKLQLFKDCQTLIYCSDNKQLQVAIKEQLPNITHLAWGFAAAAEIPLTKRSQSSHSSEWEINYKGEKHQISLPFSNTASVENALHCVVLMLYLGYSAAAINDRMQQLHQTVAMRLEWKAGINQCMLIDDTYNNDLAGLRIALDFMAQKHQDAASVRKTLILSDIPESGINAEVLYGTVARWLRDYGIHKFIGIGTALAQQQSLFKGSAETHFFSKTADFINALEQNLNFRQETILLKGARSFEFERIVRLLRKRTHSTVLELDLKALEHNFNVYRKHLQANTKIMVMVKAFAYGSSSYEVAKLLQYHKVDYLGVAYIDEGVELRKKGISAPIMVMNAAPEAFEQLVKYRLEPSIYSLNMLSQLAECLSQMPETGLPLPIHIEVDTGMHRLGFAPDEAERIVEQLNKYKNYINPIATFSHLAAADEAEQNDFTAAQITEFEEFAAKLEKGLDKKLIKHILNSAGITRFAQKQLDMVRLGIGLHGIDPNGFFSRELQAVATLRTVISQLRRVAAGSAVGYGRHSFSGEERIIATLAIGYADGLMRACGNARVTVLVNGRLCPLVGNICMDMCFADVTLADAAEGDEVIIFGPELPIEILAEALGTIPYEILTHISGRVPRVFFEA